MKNLFVATALAMGVLSAPVMAMDTVAQAGIWSVESNTGSNYFSAQKSNAIVALECLNGHLRAAITYPDNKVADSDQGMPIEIATSTGVYTISDHPQSQADIKAFWAELKNEKLINFSSKLGTVKNVKAEGLVKLMSDIGYEYSNCAAQ